MTDPHRRWRRARLNRLLPDSLRKLDARAKPDLKRAVPALFAELARRGWSDSDLRKLAGENLLRVFAQAEAVSKRLQRESH